MIKSVKCEDACPTSPYWVRYPAMMDISPLNVHALATLQMCESCRSFACYDISTDAYRHVKSAIVAQMLTTEHQRQLSESETHPATQESA